jgi:hypothetical protein
VAADVLQGLLQILHHPHTEDQVGILGAPVVLAGRLAHTEGAGRGVTAELHPGGGEGRDRQGQERRGHGVVQQQGFDRVAGGRVLGLAVDRHPQGLLQINGGIHVEVADAIGMAEHRDAGVVLDEAHQGIAAAGDDQVHEAVKLQQRQAFGAAGEQLQGRRIDAAGGEPGLQGAMDGGAAAAGLATPLEQGAVAGADRQGGDLHHRVGACLEDHPHHPQRHGEALQHQPLVEFGVELAATDRIRQGRHLAHPGDGGLQLGAIELQAGDQGRGQALGARRLQVAAVGRQDRFAIGLEGIGHRLQGRLALAVAGLGQGHGGAAHGGRAAEQFGAGIRHNGGIAGLGRSGHRSIIQPAGCWW